MKKVTITRKIELRFNSENNEDRNAFYKDIMRWQKICQKAANMMASHLYVILNQEDFFYLSEFGRRNLMDENMFAEMDKKQKTTFLKAENKEIYKVSNAEKEALFTGNIKSTYYQLLSQRYLTECPSAILSSLSNVLFKNFQSEKIDLIQGKKSLRSYGANMPIPIPSSLLIHIRKSEYKNKLTNNFSFTLFKHPLRTHLGADLSGNNYLLSEAFSSNFLPSYVIDAETDLSNAIVAGVTGEIEIRERLYSIEKILGEDVYLIKNMSNDCEVLSFKMRKQEYSEKIKNEQTGETDKQKKVRYIIIDNIKLCDSSIQIKKVQEEDKNGVKRNITKIFFLAVLQMDKKEVILDESKVAQVYLSPEVPLLVNINDKIFKIGSKDDFLYRRTGIQGAYRTVQRDLRFEGGGRGRKRKMKGIERYKNYEKNVVKDKIHNYTRKLIDLCMEFKCKYIYLLNEERTKEQAKENPYIMRNYSVGSFSSFIREKASRVNMEVISDAEKESDNSEDI